MTVTIFRKENNEIRKGKNMLLEFLVTLDGKILLLIQEFLRFDWLSKLMKVITMLGDAGVIWIILAFILLCTKKYRKTGTVMAVALVTGYMITNLFLKNLVMRPRPYEVVEGLESVIGVVKGSSFPSGHTTSSIAAGFVMFQNMKNYVGILSFSLAILISFSRLYLGVHYPTDVLMGVVVGIFSAYFAKHMTKS